MRYYNKTKENIPYVVTDFKGYVNFTNIKPNHYFPSKPWLGRRYAGFDCGDLSSIFRRSDFNKLTKIK